MTFRWTVEAVETGYKQAGTATTIHEAMKIVADRVVRNCNDMTATIETKMDGEWTTVLVYHGVGIIKWDLY